MKHKAKLIADRLTCVLSSWDAVECISLNETAHEDTLNPYFALIFDVFYKGNIPHADERQAMFGEDLVAFETSHKSSKDRFLIGDYPIRIEYKATCKVESLVAIADTKLESLWFIKDSGTYGFYRLQHGSILFSRNAWIENIRDRLSHLSDDFWFQIRQAHQSKMEHLLNDLGQAFFLEDDFNYLISEALFIKTACLTLFCVNRHFEPSHRAYYKQVVTLPILPEAFRTHLDMLLRFNAEITKERQYSIAQLIAKSIVIL